MLEDMVLLDCVYVLLDGDLKTLAFVNTFDCSLSAWQGSGTPREASGLIRYLVVL